MDRRKFIKSTLATAALAATIRPGIAKANTGKKISITNPYAKVDWDKFGQYKANLHCHTIMSDGHACVNDMAKVYKDAGFSILAISDHDCVIKEKRPKELLEATCLDKNCISFITWPWCDFGGKSPRTHGLTGIEACELTTKHHMNSYFNGYSLGANVKNNYGYTEDQQLDEVQRRGGLSIVNHPGIQASWNQEKSLQWYVDLFKDHPADCLVGMEITNRVSEEWDGFDISLWDQLLAEFSPGRPVWGFGNDDAHSHNHAKFTFNVFYFDICSQANVRQAMLDGQFTFCDASRKVDYTKEKIEDGMFPYINSIKVDEKAQTITIDAKDYEQLRWITAPKSSKPIGDFLTSKQPWELGQVVGDAKTISYNSPAVKNYLRAELIHKDGKESYRTFVNPFGVEKI
ncbi:MAG: hypothetical protein KAS96_08960 [Planctomycetes bacterium]|nr:hypothetical protein [Planctomycetota bacterium]